MSETLDVLDMEMNEQGTYEYLGNRSRQTKTEKENHNSREGQNIYGAQQQTYHEQYSTNLNDIYSNMAERNNEYLKNMRSAFEDSRKKMLDQMQSMTGRF